jgi:hypothetical protein
MYVFVCVPFTAIIELNFDVVGTTFHLLYFFHFILGDYSYIVEKIKEAAISVEEVITVSEVQVYYKDGGSIASKLDIVLSPTLTIKQAHNIAGWFLFSSYFYYVFIFFPFLHTVWYCA